MKLHQSVFEVQIIQMTTKIRHVEFLDSKITWPNSSFKKEVVGDFFVL